MYEVGFAAEEQNASSQQSIACQPVEDLATRIEAEMSALVTIWGKMEPSERASVLGHISTSAPGIARLLCPNLGRFGFA